MSYEERKKALELKPTALDTGFPAETHCHVGGERDILPTWEHGTRTNPKRTPKPKVELEDLSHLNAPHTERLQSQVKKMWAEMSPEERAEAVAVRRDNARATYNRNKKHRNA